MDSGRNFLVDFCANICQLALSGVHQFGESLDHLLLRIINCLYPKLSQSDKLYSWLEMDGTRMILLVFLQLAKSLSESQSPENIRFLSIFLKVGSLKVQL